ncbi:xylulokinase [Falsiroseomonas selenitidurans]|uniref:FGGY-family carbohydrate kinase n=1 Tax=Falsiroseomonas selenitidurans TaxID=2716335 RepID=A0ABX1DYE7_9PROT|nr:FGGY-family carbohydrate kinase [Falsiroseomonas selenitidurans]NKC29886.1 FGGY-family carbohydrate kinase [Falsiroseomonas selenitidurans]
MLDSCVLAFDLGGSSLRAALIRRDGTPLARHDQKQRLGVEADAEAWWRAVQAGAAALRVQDAAAFARIGAIAISAVTRSLVPVDSAGRPTHPALLFGDARAAAVLPALLALLPAEHPERPQVNAFHPLARLAWLAQAAPAALARSAAILEPKDFLNLRLTGRVASDRISAARLAASAALLPRLGLAESLLPPLLPPGAILGPLLPGVLEGLAGVPVLVMAHDTWAAVAGLGALRPGHAYCISGTTEVLGLLADAPAQAPGLLTVAWDGLHQIGGPSQHGADALAWLAGLGVEVGRGDPPPGDPIPLLFLPTLAGERVPHWDPDRRGAFLGLRRDHGPADLARAVMQGIAFNNRTVLYRAEAAAGRQAVAVHLGGGGATPGWAQLRADVLGRPVVLSATPEPGLLGAAIIAFAALEGLPLAALQDQLARPAAQCVPDAARHALATRLHAAFQAAEAAVAPISHLLA